ncbi:phage major capsid protein [Oceanobacillus jordanicus]|uniref:Phage major capsid protein n=1 Tax=Oceanobacillus jordanicus TaxID=2867266 RepID=A0AAW5B3Y5_9BACI|nr:phage major capsid protein [Oceanobacillus jordanicus]MCG3418972.1 phage major capsid protein [Oceanobacillus jordanicus]
MTIKLKGKLENFENKKQAYMDVVKNEEATTEQHETAFNEMFTALQTDLTEKISNEARNEVHDAQVLSARGQNVLTSKERKFFNEVIASEGFAEDTILPITTQERVFEDLKTEHPLLEAIGLKDLGAITRYIYSDATKAYAWGALFGEIKGQISAAFREEKVEQLKLTAFAVIPKDMLVLGPEYVERYVRTVLVESYSVGLEYGLVSGRGPSQNEPIGLMKDVAENGAVTTKTSSGTLTFARSEKGEVVAKELGGVVVTLSKDAKGKARKVANKIIMLASPIDKIKIEAGNTIQTDNGQWVLNLPYNIKPVESEEVPEGKVLFFVQDAYLAAIAGGYKINKFDETLAIEDARLYTMKQFANGKPKDNNTAKVYDLDIDFTVPTEEPTEPAGA